MGVTRVFTYTLSGSSITLAESDNVQSISIQTLTGVTTVTGNTSVPFQGLTASPVQLGTGEGITITANVFGNPVAGLVISAGGNCKIILTVS
jgi:hypothetical protein